MQAGPFSYLCSWHCTRKDAVCVSSGVVQFPRGANEGGSAGVAFNVIKGKICIVLMGNTSYESRNLVNEWWKINTFGSSCFVLSTC